MTRRRRRIALLALATGLAVTCAAAPAPSDLAAAEAARVAAARNYRESLEALLPLREAAAERARARLERNRELFERGIIAAIELAASERAAQDAGAAAEHTRGELAQADALVTEAEAAHELALAPRPRPDAAIATDRLLRYDGRVPWSLAQLPTLEAFFAERFRRPLPVSALGQTPVHDRLGFDHREAVDIAVHPDSAEGRALTDYLRAHGIPFLAFRGARAGVATGAHVHIGRPSPHA